jgi:FMN-dependent NADH-azoreductase
MTKFLFDQASPRGGQSKSIQVAEAYLAPLCAANPDLEVDELPLWETDLPVFDGDKAAAKDSSGSLPLQWGSFGLIV